LRSFSTKAALSISLISRFSRPRGQLSIGFEHVPPDRSDDMPITPHPPAAAGGKSAETLDSDGIEA
jgi:hypothetical protein